MILDCHIHLKKADRDDAPTLLAKMNQAGIDGGVILSLPPNGCISYYDTLSGAERARHVVDYCKGHDTLFPFFWIDPVEDDAERQVEQALAAGVEGFKVICFHFYPDDERAMRVYRQIAEAGKPILFHSGILWDVNASGKYNRPSNFECLMEIPQLRFALAHISWPWVDEHLAVYGKLAAAAKRGAQGGFEMFIDTTPGTPPMYRREALTKIFGIGYNVQNNVLFGTDGMADDLNIEAVSTTRRMDEEIYQSLGLEKAYTDHIFSKNLLRFVGRSDERLQERPKIDMDW
jgi:predicted TIM-barrel fold metal-dependent hydrolase